ncbi:MAG: SPOR domain-containing protein [Bacteroidales bacterium]
MKKLFFYSVVALVALGATSCKPKQTAYKAAYEKAKPKEITPVNQPVVQPTATVTRPATTATPATTRKEVLTPVTAADASGLKSFSVVIGSFTRNDYAVALKESMEKEGYKVILAQNEKLMYRVIVASFNTKEEAAAERDRIKAKYTPRFDDIWLLERQF